jgi:hypothetical protein
MRNAFPAIDFDHPNGAPIRVTDDQMAEAVCKATRFEDAIAETAAEGLLGLAVKVFSVYQAGRTIVPKGRLGGDPCALHPPTDCDDCLSPLMSLSAVPDIARLVPGLAPLCAPALAEEAPTAA